MGISSIPREFLANRDNWQEEANQRGAASEGDFCAIMERTFHVLREKNSGVYRVERKPKHLSGLYGPNGQWGVQPDAAVTNDKTGRTVFVEIKRQRPRGNAHERACKYFAPGLVSAARERGRVSEDDFPFFWIFTNGLATDEKYRSEIAFWFSGSSLENHFLLWSGNLRELLEFFVNKMRPVIDRPYS